MEYSPLFYGYYNGTYEFDFVYGSYAFPLAYFLVMFAIFLINMGTVMIGFADAFQNEKWELDDSQTLVSEEIFCGWDWSIKSSVKADNVMKPYLEGITLILQ